MHKVLLGAYEIWLAEELLPNEWPDDLIYKKAQDLTHMQRAKALAWSVLLGPKPAAAEEHNNTKFTMNNSQLADELRITPQAISQWRRVPVGRVLDVERLTGVSRHKLRPDIYPLNEQKFEVKA